MMMIFTHALFPLAVCTIHSIDGEVDTRPLTLEDVLVFATGANCVPPTGIGKKVTIDFVDTYLFPVASKCSLTLYLPTCLLTYNEFKAAMVEGLVSGAGFGQA